MPAIPGLFSYVGPETFLPLTSVLAAVLGVVLMLWRSVLRVMQGIWYSYIQPRRRRRMPKPHFQASQTERTNVCEDAVGS